ncbi:hypothetical protein POTOM_019324 [Populus tomentosa]|uniref:Uncharacterized protein n=1 Tax=Populus tomentosa TaxID=118781 RepID=A0A8X8A793_POPTO|nr:hypothetical protein POTOM_019324 [Populus tomentosa]
MEVENEMHVQNDKHVDTAGALESSPNLKKCACAIEPDPDSSGGRLRRRRRKSNGKDVAEFTKILVLFGYDKFTRCGMQNFIGEQSSRASLMLMKKPPLHRPKACKALEPPDLSKE